LVPNPLRQYTIWQRLGGGLEIGLRRLFAGFDGEFSRRSPSYAGKDGARVTW